MVEPPRVPAQKPIHPGTQWWSSRDCLTMEWISLNSSWWWTPVASDSRSHTAFQFVSAYAIMSIALCLSSASYACASHGLLISFPVAVNTGRLLLWTFYKCFPQKRRLIQWNTLAFLGPLLDRFFKRVRCIGLPHSKRSYLWAFAFLFPCVLCFCGRFC